MAVVIRARASALAIASLLIAGCDDDDERIIIDAGVFLDSAVPDASPDAGPVNVSGFRRVDLVSDQEGVAQRVDPDLVNAWGIVASPKGLWIADNGTGKLSVFDGNGDPARIGTGTFDLGEGLTGIVASSSSQLVIRIGGTSAPARILVASEAGTVTGVNPALSTTQGDVVIDRSSVGAIYKGIAIANHSGNVRVFVADFHNARIDVFDKTFAPVTLPATAFKDPNLPDGFAPFNIIALRDRLFVTYAKQDETATDDVPGPGLGLIDVYDTNGKLVRRLATAGTLNAPWGMAFGPVQLANERGNFLVVGNFGDGMLTAIDPESGRIVGLLNDTRGAPIVIDGLWGITFGNGQNNTDPTVIYFAAGPDDEMHGLFGRLEPVVFPPSN